MNIRYLSFVFLYFISSQAVLAIDPVYEGENGIRENVLATNCLNCHSSELSGSQRNGAPSSVDYDTFATAMVNADRAIVRAVNLMSMPPAVSSSPKLNQEQKDAILAWQKAGFPETQTTNDLTNATFDFANSTLTLPVVLVGELTYRATLKLANIPGSPLGFGFILETAELNQDTSDTAATFIPESGVVDMPEVDLLNSTNSSTKASVQMLLKSGSDPLEFEVISVNFIN